MYGTFLLLAIAAQLASAALPLGWKSCKMSSPGYNKCLSHQIEFAIASLKNGSKKLGILPIDPLHFNTVVIDQSTGPVSIKLVLNDFNFHGLSKAKILEVQNDWKELNIKFFFSEVNTKGRYKINGKILILPIQGDGQVNMGWYNMTVDGRILLRDVERKRKKFFDVPQFLVDLEPKKLTVNFQNLFNGDKALGDNMNLFMNENWEEILKELKPAIRKALSQGFAQVANQVFSKIPKNEIQVQ